MVYRTRHTVVEAVPASMVQVGPKNGRCISTQQPPAPTRARKRLFQNLQVERGLGGESGGISGGVAAELIKGRSKGADQHAAEEI